jgi:hypothetical protein
MTRRQNRIGESMSLLPDGDTGPSVLNETRQRAVNESHLADVSTTSTKKNDTATKGN